mmetsp:Transcript_105700/g.204657  ORF Transcript_105700/g.204657 Transcript_105700/m.204657 type:complete len:136 (+) Transcript_105700:76-483(+)
MVRSVLLSHIVLAVTLGSAGMLLFNGMKGSESSFIAPSRQTPASVTARSAAEVDGTDTSLMEETGDRKYQPNTFMLDKDKKKGKSEDPGFALLAAPLAVWFIIIVALFIYNTSQSAPPPAPPPPPTMPPPTMPGA